MHSSSSSNTQSSNRKGRIMENIKWFTQRITGILVFLIVVAILVIFAQLLKLVGLWQYVDSFYPNSLVMFWILMVITRAAFAAAWIYSSVFVGKKGKEHSFFWFDPTDDSPRWHKPDPVDQSGPIIGIVGLAFLLLVLTEFAIRLATLIEPLYLVKQ